MRALLAGISAAVGVLVAGLAISAAEPGADAGLKPVTAFASIADESDRSVAIFAEAGKVIQHPRCFYCHPAGDRRAQGDDGHPHQPLVVRG